jgi:predicted SAM-dependent methyltransferase
MKDLKTHLKNKYKGKKGLKLNIACGGRILPGFINIDKKRRENLQIEIEMDVRDGLPFDDESCSFIYAEQFLEHLTWLEGKNFLQECNRCLEKEGTLRIVIPHYKKIFSRYIADEREFFQIYYKELNELDYPYYKEQGNLERQRIFKVPIEIVDWFVHQFGEHKCLYDYLSLSLSCWNTGFLFLKQTARREMDSDAPSRIDSSLYVEAQK